MGLCATDVWLEKPRYEAAEAELAQALARIAAQKKTEGQTGAKHTTATQPAAGSKMGNQ